MSDLIQDLRFAVRQLLKNPGFTAAAVLTLALGIGANTAIFSVVNAVLLRPLPYEEPDRLVHVHSVSEHGPATVSPPDFVDFREQSRSFEALAAFHRRSFTISGDAPAERVAGARVSADFFRVLGVQPERGRWLAPDDEVLDRHRVVVVSQAFWQRRLGGDPAVLGRDLRVDGEPYMIVGVAPGGFDYEPEAQLWVPLAFTTEDLTTQRGAHYLQVIGRLRPGATVERAKVEMEGIAARLADQYPDTNTGYGAGVVPLRGFLVGDVRPALLALLGAVGFLLLIACVNVANLLLARGVSRDQELAVRTALGAGRGRLVRGLVTESVALGLLGGGAGLLVGIWGVSLVRTLRSAEIPRVEHVTVDGSVLAFTFGIALATGLLFGILPALQATSRIDVTEKLKTAGRGVPGDAAGRRTRNSLVVAEIALALVLVAGAGLLLKSFVRLARVDPGFDPENVVTFNLVLPEARYAEADDAEAFFATLLEEIETLPGVEAAGAVFGLPLTDFYYGISVNSVDGVRPASPEEEKVVQVRVVTPNYFQAMRIPLLRGRPPEERDRHGATSVAVVNESAARLLWPGQDPLGHEVLLGTGFGLDRGRAGGTVIGVVRDVKHFGLGRESAAEVYLVHRQFPVDFMNVVVRSSSDPRALLGAIQRRLAALDPEVPMSRVRTMEEWVARSVAEPRLYTLLLGVFAAIAIALAAVGIYGVMAYAVAQRTREIGIRMALGARRDDVLRRVVGQGLTLALTGTAIGLAGAWGATRAIAGLLYGVRPTDAATLGTVAALLIAVALMACYLPARRAMSVDPMEALRYE